MTEDEMIGQYHWFNGQELDVLQSSTIFFKFMSIESMMLSNHLNPLLPLLLPLPSIVPSIRVFSNQSALCIRWPKYWSFSFSINSSNEYSGLTSFRIDWFELLAVQRTLKSLFQHHNSEASVLWRMLISGFKSILIFLSTTCKTRGKTYFEFLLK